jgi:hypothetical protein
MVEHIFMSISLSNVTMDSDERHVVTFMSGMLTSNLWKASVPENFRLTSTTAEVGSGGYVCDVSPSIT